MTHDRKGIDASDDPATLPWVAKEMRNAATVSGLVSATFMDDGRERLWHAMADDTANESTAIKNGDRSPIEEALWGQACSLQSIYTKMALLAQGNLGNAHVAETYLRLSLKAQAQSRATLEALAKIKQPREQIVRHVHVHEGGQAVVADEFHHHAGGSTNAGSNEQPHAAVTALSSPHPLGLGVPIPCDTGQEALPHARRSVTGRAEG